MLTIILGTAYRKGNDIDSSLKDRTRSLLGKMEM